MANNVQALARRTSGVAPLAVSFNAVSIAGVVEPPVVNSRRAYDDYTYKWDFGDVNSGVWASDGKSKNIEYGHIAAHVFETTGVYSVILSIDDNAGTVTSYDVTITVGDPEAVYSGTNTVCVSTGTDFTGCPAGAQQVTTTNPVITGYMGVNKRILYRRGDTWTSSAVQNYGNAGPMTIGAFGAGINPDARGIYDNAPKITLTSAVEDGFFKPGGDTDTRIMDLWLDDPTNVGTAIGGLTNINRLTFARMKVTGFLKGCIHSHWNTLGHRELCYYDCDLSGSTINNLYIGSEYLMLIGNKMTDTRNSHILRVWQNYKGVIAHGENSGSSTLTTDGRHAIKQHGPTEGMITTPGGSQLTERTKYFIIKDMLIGASGPWPVAAGPINPQNDERLSDGIIENLRVYSGYGTLSAVLPSTSISVWADYVTVRNNICAGEGSNANSYTGILFSQRGSEPVHQGCKVYNNTIYKQDGNAGGNFTAIAVSSTHSNTDVRNNYAFFISSGNNVMLNDSGIGTAQSNNVLTAVHGLIDPDNVSYLSKDFRPLQTSNAINAGITIPLSIDFDDLTRPKGSTYDLGAFEFQSGGSGVAIISNPNVSPITPTGGTPYHTTDDPTGTGYCVAVSTGSVAPSAVQIKAGQDSTGAAALDSSSVSISSATPAYPNFTLLLAFITYDVYFVQES